MSGNHLRFERVPHWEIQPFEYLSSIVFVDPAFTASLLRIDSLTWVDGVYWTLWVEMRFYALVALIYWLTSSGQRFVLAWLVIQSVSLLLPEVIELTSFGPHWILNLTFQPIYVSRFTLGICGFHYWTGPISAPLMAMTLVSLIGLASSGASASAHIANVSSLSHILLNIFVVSTFALFLVRSPAMKLFENRWAITLGLASYPLYMLHERVGVIAHDGNQRPGHSAGRDPAGDVRRPNQLCHPAAPGS